MPVIVSNPEQAMKDLNTSDAPLLEIARQVVGETPTPDLKPAKDETTVDAVTPPDGDQAEKDKASMRSAPEHRDGVIGLYEALNLPEGGLLGDLLNQSGLPKMSEIPKVYRQRYVDIRESPVSLELVQSPVRLMIPRSFSRRRTFAGSPGTF